MADPQTPTIAIYQPTRGSDPGTWDSPVNANAGAADSLAGNVAVIGLTNLAVTLTTPPTSGAAWSGPYQSQSGILRLTGTLTADCIITIPRAGFFIVQNNCVPGAFVPILRAAAVGNVIGIPPGEAVHVICDGTNMDFVGLGRINEYEDWATTVMPRWVTACTVPPYLNCIGAAFSGVIYPNTALYLGGTTLPDARGRSRFTLNQATGRITSVSATGIDGNTLLAGGGSQTPGMVSLPAVPAPINASGTPTVTGSQPAAGFPSAGTQSGHEGTGGGVLRQQDLAPFDAVVINNNNAPLGSGRPLLPPGYVGGITVLRAG